MNSKLRDELNLLFDDGRIAYASDKPPHVHEVYINRAEIAIRQVVGEEMLELIGDDEQDTGIGQRLGAIAQAEMSGRNWQKRLLRQKIKQWQGGEGD